MTIDGQKYLGWQLASISLENQIFTIDLKRYSLTRAEALDLASQRTQAKLIFASVERIVLSKVHGGGKVSDIRYSHDDTGKVFCELKFSLGGSIAVAAGEVADLLF
jgi:hypothetical protein